MTAGRRFAYAPGQRASVVVDPREWSPTREGVAQLVAALREFVEERVPSAVDPGAPLFRIERPCGRVYEFDTVDDFPVYDLPCGCGDPDCVVVEWREIGDA